MTEPQALQKLLVWLSPAFPVGAFAWSSGLETAIIADRVRTAAAAREWIESALHHGGLRSDGIFLAESWRRMDDAAGLRELADLAIALIPSSERLAETTSIGDAFIAAARAWPNPVLDRLPRPCPYPIAVGAIAAAHDVDLGDTLLAFLTAAAHGLVSVALRLVPLGQTDGLGILAALEPLIARRATELAGASLDDLGTIGIGADIAQMQHETLQTRIFRS